MADFSSRHGYRGEPQEISIREDAPEGVRFAVPLIARGVGIAPKKIRQVVCEALLIPPDPNNWGDEPVTEEVNELIQECHWFKVYDIAEGLYALIDRHNLESAAEFEKKLNQYFFENGIGWQMGEGEITYRGSEVFRDATAGAVESLAGAGHTTAADEVHSVLQDISRRPKQDLTGAIRHVMAALECVARDLTGERKATLGKVVYKLDIPPPLDLAVDKLWGFASDRARHVREGQKVSPEEAELIVIVACGVCNYLSAVGSPDE